LRRARKNLQAQTFKNNNIDNRFEFIYTILAQLVYLLL
jgi:hypothetical protein